MNKFDNKPLEVVGVYQDHIVCRKIAVVGEGMAEAQMVLILLTQDEIKKLTKYLRDDTILSCEKQEVKDEQKKV